MAIKGDLKTDDADLAVELVAFVFVDPGVGDVGFYLAFKIVVDRLAEGDVLVVAQGGVGLDVAFVFAAGDEADIGVGVLLAQGAEDGAALGGAQVDTVGLQGLFKRLFEAGAAQVAFGGVEGLQGLYEPAAVVLVHLFDHALFGHTREALGAGLEVQAKRALDGDAPVAEGVVGKDFAGRGLLKSPVEAHDLFDLRLGDVVALAAQRFAHFGEILAGVDKLDLALAFGGLGVGQNPHIGGDAGVVEHVGGQGDNRLDQ